MRRFDPEFGVPYRGLRQVFELHTTLRAGKFSLRQGLWIEDLQTPPGQECSNGSMILLAVVLWRAFSCW
jgi:hypothetical protein